LKIIPCSVEQSLDQPDQKKKKIKLEKATAHRTVPLFVLVPPTMPYYPSLDCKPLQEDRKGKEKRKRNVCKIQPEKKKREKKKDK
jgi:hypothetical protein